jgi:hypothetical protein
MDVSEPRLGRGIEELGEAFSKLFDLQRTIGTEILDLFTRGFGTSFQDTVERLADLRLPSWGTGSCCDIPEPCWMPRSLGQFRCRLCPGSTGSLQLVITNEDIVRRSFAALASGAAAGQVSFSPSSLVLGPKERGTMTASFALPANVADGGSFEALVWLRGCRDYYARWLVTAVSRSIFACCHTVSVCDGPDNLLHWYDHFYCPRSCFGGGTSR